MVLLNSVFLMSSFSIPWRFYRKLGYLIRTYYSTMESRLFVFLFFFCVCACYIYNYFLYFFLFSPSTSEYYNNNYNDRRHSINYLQISLSVPKVVVHIFLNLQSVDKVLSVMDKMKLFPIMKSVLPGYWHCGSESNMCN